MKKILLITTIFMSSLFTASAQDDQAANDNNRQEKIKALYVAYITQQLNLTEAEAQKFWPLHAQFETDIKTVKPDLPELEKQQAVLNIKKKYQDNFNRILGPNRCERFFKMDGEFKRKLLDKIRKQRMDQQRPKIRRGV
jgi:Skp family chaperone for outer membrane proteins